MSKNLSKFNSGLKNRWLSHWAYFREVNKNCYSAKSERLWESEKLNRPISARLESIFISDYFFISISEIQEKLIKIKSLLSPEEKITFFINILFNQIFIIYSDELRGKIMFSVQTALEKISADRECKRR